MRKQIVSIGIVLFCIVIGACKNETEKISDVENQIVEEYAPNPNEVGYAISYENFKNVLIEFPEASFCYNFNKLVDINYVKIVDSPDKTMRTYTKNDGSLFVIQVKSGNDIYTFDVNDDDLESLSLDYFEDINNIIPVRSDRNDIIYILCNKEYRAVAVRLLGETLESALVFEDEDDDYSSKLYSSLSEIDGVKIDYKDDTRELKYPEDMVSDAVEYIVYTFNGRVFKRSGVAEESLLHASVQDYEESIYCFLSEKVNVRIDRLRGGTFRYAAWKSGKNFTEKPDLVLFGNSYKKNHKTGDDEFTFVNEGYSYIMKITSDNENAELFVVKGGDVLAHYVEY